MTDNRFCFRRVFTLLTSMSTFMVPWEIRNGLHSRNWVLTGVEYVRHPNVIASLYVSVRRTTEDHTSVYVRICPFFFHDPLIRFDVYYLILYFASFPTAAFLKFGNNVTSFRDMKLSIQKLTWNKLLSFDLHIRFNYKMIENVLGINVRTSSLRIVILRNGITLLTPSRQNIYLLRVY